MLMYFNKKLFSQANTSFTAYTSCCGSHEFLMDIRCGPSSISLPNCCHVLSVLLSTVNKTWIYDLFGLLHGLLLAGCKWKLGWQHGFQESLDFFM
jgi:hypothetical protein